jgi:hypothetical protein
MPDMEGGTGSADAMGNATRDAVGGQMNVSEKLPCGTTGDICGFTSTYYIGMISGPPNQ